MSCKLRNTLAMLALSMAAVWCMPAFGQVLKGSISGTVTDPQGAVVSGAKVKTTNTATGTSYDATSDNSGSFRVNLIPAGDYKIEITQQGFQTAVQKDVSVTPGVDHNVGSIKLSVGESNITVDVGAEAPLIEPTQSQITNTFSGTTLTTFAGVQEFQGLDNLALFVPGVVASRDIGFSNTNGGGGFSSNGLRGRNNDQEIDGQNNNDNSVGGPSLFISDAEFAQQYVIVTNNFGPEYGRNSGSVVNIITKSGTSTLHGSIYESENNSILNSMNSLAKQFGTHADGTPLTKPDRLNNEFGGFTVGGPIVKNKSFFFGGFDQQIISTTAQLHTDALTPTPAGLAQLNGCFPASPSLQAFNKYGPFGISGGNPVATKVSPNPADPSVPRQFFNINVGTCTGVQFGGVSRFLPQPVHNFNWTARNDTQLGNSDYVTARYLFQRANFFNLDFGSGAAGYPIDVPALSQAFLLSETHNFSPHMVNEARVAYSRLNVDFGGNSIGTVPTANQVTQAVATVTFSANTGPIGTFLNAMGGGTGFPQARIVNTWQLQDNWNYIVGKHTFKAGVNFTYQRSPNTFLPNIDGSYRFTNWTSFVNDTPNRVRLANGVPSLDFREYDTFLYVGDDWKVTQHLTLNLGLTWTYFGSPENLFNDITTKRESNPATAFWASVAPANDNNPGSPLPLSVRTNPKIPSIYNSFGPSIGFAYTPDWGGWLTGHGKTTVRGGYRLLYDPPYYNIFLNTSNSAPFVFLQTFSGGAAASKPLGSNPIGVNNQAALSPFVTKGAFDPRNGFAQTTVSPNFGPDKVHSYSFGFEREVTKNSAFEVRYAGNMGNNLFSSVNGNPFIADLKTAFPNLVPSNLTPCPAGQAFAPIATGRVNCQQGIVLARTNDGYSRYNALQTEFRANNLFKQLTIRTGYTWSKTMDNVSEIFSSFGAGNSLTLAQNPTNVKGGEYSFSGLDIPHQWTINVTEQLPFFKEQHGVIGHVLGGWGLSGNYILASGQRYTPVQGSAAAALTAAGDYYDINFLANFAGVDLARPFVGNLSAPSTSVGIYAADACNNFGLACAVAPNQLISMNALNIGTGPQIVNVTTNQVRFIINSSEAQSIFGTPFGAPRNLVADAITNIANFSVFKKFKLTERTSFEFRMTMINAFNHPNFTTIDPFIEDAGLRQQGTGFGDPSVQTSVQPGSQAPATRQILFGGTLRF